MRNYKSINCFLIFLIILISISLFSSYVNALAITPPKINLAYMPGTHQEFMFKVIEAENLEVSLEGDLSDINKKPIIIDNGNGMYFVKVEFDVPINMTPGEHSLNVLFGDLGKSEAGKSASVSAKMKMRVPISFIVPYPNKYLKVNGWEWDKKVIKGNPLHISINLHSYGKEKVNKVNGKIIVKDMFEKNLVQEKSVSEASNINLDEEANLEGSMMIPDNWPFGIYNVKAVLNYDGQEINTQEYYFVYGDLLLEILNVSPLEIGKGAIVPLNIEVQNYWSEKVNFAAKVRLYDLNGNLVVEGVSSQGEVVPLGNGMIKLYLEGTNLKVGDYNLEVLLSYQGKETKKSFVLKVTDKKNEVEAGKEILNQESDDDIFFMTSSLLVIIILLLLLGIIFMFRKNKEGRSDF